MSCTQITACWRSINVTNSSPSRCLPSLPYISLTYAICVPRTSLRQATNASAYKRCTPVCLFGGKGNSENENEDSSFSSTSMDSLGKSFNPNNCLKEAFVSNLTGSSMLEIVALSTIVPVLMILGRLISYKVVIDPAAMETSLKKNDNSCVGSKNWRAYMATMAVEFLFIVLLILLFFTVLAEWTNQVLIIRGMNYISQNKEGIFSIFGYWGMYLVGIQMGNYLFFGNESTTLSRSSNWARSRVWFLSLLFWLLTVLLDWHVERVSRRMCNLAYVTMVLAQNLQVLAILMLSDYIPGRKTSVLEEAFNQNLLGSFLLANLLTGLVNLFVDTLFVSSVAALVILLVYAFILSAITGFAHFMASS